MARGKYDQALTSLNLAVKKVKPIDISPESGYRDLSGLKLSGKLGASKQTTSLSYP